MERNEKLSKRIMVQCARCKSGDTIPIVLGISIFTIEEIRMVSPDLSGCLFQDKQFKRAVQEGSIAMLVEELKESIIEAYITIGRANNYLMAIWNHAPGSSQFKESMNTLCPLYGIQVP